LVNARPPRQQQRRAPSRLPRHRYKPIKMKRMGWMGRAVIAAATAILGLVVWAALAREFAPTSNTNLQHFDAILVLGSRADSDGNPTPEELARVTEAVHEYERGVAPRLIFTGGPAHNRFVEAEVMARTAAAQGIPPSAIFIETQAGDTVQNACFSARIMKSHGWRSAEVVSSAPHLPRAGIIFSHLSLDWRTHAASSLQPEGSAYSAAISALETLKTMRYLTYASWAEQCEP
jgi:uncharacterized SAM-binding protein YcdF (DUF218 family)